MSINCSYIFFVKVFTVPIMTTRKLDSKEAIMISSLVTLAIICLIASVVLPIIGGAVALLWPIIATILVIIFTIMLTGAIIGWLVGRKKGDEEK